MIKTGDHLAKTLQQLFVIHLLAKFSYFLVLFVADQLFKSLGLLIFFRDLAFGDTLPHQKASLSLGLEGGWRGESDGIATSSRIVP